MSYDAQRNGTPTAICGICGTARYAGGVEVTVKEVADLIRPRGWVLRLLDRLSPKCVHRWM
jgi:hypothetical protein